ncbi:MATE family efflux transporter [Caldisalinibacter kiritimatiensis]|uniref:Multi antimicrobial extrusion protein (Na(+)/drug antiporter) n=1 Tax=Caldisalinibacter kiritimatiensis TaxID=1304284 RepID=R1ARB3_9FIRM|nr:MATE family efflux transporter [Caldisalinibacter kiritimatiensis]EOC99241.1 Multi antimicrobial extrusion protein (Na(+)/drug antiporter) [Caldisalinibacter kiritimatiensis]
MDFSEKRDLILNGKMTKVILTLSGPIMLNNFIQTIYNLADTFWVSQLGSTEVAAIQLVWPVIFFIMALGLGVSIGGTALISQYTGSHNLEEASDIAGQLLSFSFIFSLIFGILGGLSAPYIVKAMGGTGDLFYNATAFLRIIFFGMPTMFIFFSFNAIKQGLGDTVTPMKYGAYSVILNIILDPIFIFVLNLDIQGAAYATVLSRGLFASIAVYRLFTIPNGIKLNLSHLHINKDVLLKIVKVGLPSSIGQSTAALGFIVLNMFILSFGESTLTAFGIGNRINSLILMPAMGIGSALATVVGQNLGADNVDRAKLAVKTSAILSTIFLVIGGAIIFILSGYIIKFFNPTPEVLEQGTYYLKLISAALPLMGFFQIFIGTFQGSGHTISAMIITMGRLWGLRIPLIVIFKNFANLGPNSVWYAMILSNLIICLVGLGIYSTGRWQKKIIKKRSL